MQQHVTLYHSSTVHILVVANDKLVDSTSGVTVTCTSVVISNLHSGVSRTYEFLHRNKKLRKFYFGVSAKILTCFIQSVNYNI